MAECRSVAALHFQLYIYIYARCVWSACNLCPRLTRSFNSILLGEMKPLLGLLFIALVPSSSPMPPLLLCCRLAAAGAAAASSLL